MTDSSIESRIVEASGRQIVRWHAGWAAGASIIPLPFADMAGVMAVQVLMLRQLARLHGSEMDGARARALVLSALSGAVAPTVTASGIPSLLKAVPGIGTLLGSVAAPGAAMAATVALGDFYNRRFIEHGGAVDPVAASPQPSLLAGAAEQPMANRPGDGGSAEAAVVQPGPVAADPARPAEGVPDRAVVAVPAAAAQPRSAPAADVSHGGDADAPADQAPSAVADAAQPPLDPVADGDAADAPATQASATQASATQAAPAETATPKRPRRVARVKDGEAKPPRAAGQSGKRRAGRPRKGKGSPE